MKTLARGADAPSISDDSSTHPTPVHSDAQAAPSGTYPASRRPSYPPPSELPEHPELLIVWRFSAGDDTREIIVTRAQYDLMVKDLGVRDGTWLLVPAEGRRPIDTASLLRLLDAKAILDLARELTPREGFWARLGRVARQGGRES